MSTTLTADLSSVLRDREIKRLLGEKAPKFEGFDAAPADEKASLGQRITPLLAVAGAVYGTGQTVAAMDDLAQRCAARLEEKLTGLTNGQSVALSQNELSVLLEAALIEEKAFEMARVLVMQRALLPEKTPGPLDLGDDTLRLIRRSGQVVPWNEGKIEIAVRKAFLSLDKDSEPSVEIARRLTEQAGRLRSAYVPIETVQDLVQEELLRAGYPEVAENYILYRANRTILRLQETREQADSGQFVLLPVLEADGSSYLWDGLDLRERIRFASIGLDLSLSPQAIEAELRRSLHAEMRRVDVDKTILLNAKSLMERDADFAFFAGRILLTFLYEETLGWNILDDGLAGLGRAHQKAFRACLEQGIRVGRLSPRLREYDLDALASALDPTADLDFDYLGLQTLYDRYLITDKTGKTAHRIEVPQFFWMRVAMGLFLDEKENKEAAVLGLYRMYKERRFCSSTPTLFNAGTPHSQLSSCYLYKVDDSIESIMYRGIAENAFLSKWAGGLGGSWTSVRGTGSHISGTNGESQGVIPFLKMHNDQLVAVNQCFVPGTKLFTARGIVPIENAHEGDLVLGKDGEYRRVEQVMEYEQNDPLVEIAIKHSLEPLRVTAGHPLFALRGIPMELGNERAQTRLLDKGKATYDWVEAGQLRRGDYVAQVIPTEIVVPNDFTPNDARFYGMMLGDGHQTAPRPKGQEWGLCFNQETNAESLDFARQYLQERGIRWNESTRGLYLQMKWAVNSSKDPLFQLPFAGADLYDSHRKKRIAPRLSHLPYPHTLQLLRGLIETDGSVSRGKEITFYNTSEQLVEGLRYQLLRLGVPAAGKKQTRHFDHMGVRSDGSEVVFKGTTTEWVVRVPAVEPLAKLVHCLPLKKQNWLTLGGKVFTRVQSVKPLSGTKLVYDLKVEGVESYMTSSALAHNGGKRAGSGCAYLEVWHNDIFDFLELRRNTGDERRRTHDMNTANWIPDLFMKRMEARDKWTLFRASDTPDLHDLYGRAFETRYEEYERKAEVGEMYGKRIEALDLWKQMLKMLFETGHPWITFKDPCNVRSPQDHVGVIHSSNLCCVTADQRAVTQHGLLTVGELASLGGTLTVVGRHGTETASPMVMTIPDAPILKVVTKEGYEHRVTYDHPLWVVGKGWVEAQNLKPGDRVETQQVEGVWGQNHFPEEAFAAGIIAGDGTYSHDGTMAHIDLWQKDFHLAHELETAVASIIERHNIELRTNANACPRFVTCAKGEKLRLTSAPLATALGDLGFGRESKLRVPDFVWKGDRETVAAYLRGLFVADGTVQVFDGVVMSLASRSRELLRECQILLANMGAKCSITKMRDEETKWMPDGRGGQAEYVCAPLYRLMLTGIQACRIFDTAIDASGHRKDEKFAERLCKTGYQQKLWATVESVSPDGREDTYCLMVDSPERAWSCNGLVTKNTEITLNTSADETAVCNLGSIVLDKHLTPDGAIDHAKLRETVRMAVRALDNVIDINYYPTEAAKRSNLRHRPIGLGVMGLQYALYQKGVAFASEEALVFNDEIMEAVAYYAYEASSDLAAERGTYSTYAGSKWDRGLLPPDTLELLEAERGQPIETTRGGKLDWEPLRAKIKTQGMRNSNVLAIAPTATIANIMGTSPCIEPTYKNLYAKSNLSGDFVVLNPFLVRDLKAADLWTREVVEQIKYFDGDLHDIAEIPAEIKAKHSTAFQIPYEYLLNAAARRQKWIDQSQSLNLFLGTPDMKSLSHMYRHAWRVGLKTTYYLRTLGASNIEKATINLKKPGIPTESAAISETLAPPPRTFSEDEKLACSIDAMRNGEECEACQ